MNKRHSWHREDWITALIAAGISFAVYAWSAAPNVTLLDSGEFIVAAQKFGVPHPTGYPLWTFLTWLFLLLPLGNAAWQTAIFSGVCAALAVGFCAALLSNIQNWCLDGGPAPTRLPGKARYLPQVVALAFSLMLAFSESMWSQAVIAEVYALHALLIAIFLVFCYSWVRDPGNDRLLFGAFFTLALAFSNHQLTMALAPLPFLLVLLLRRRAFFDWFFAGLLTLLLAYLGFAILSKDPNVLKTALRFAATVGLAFGTFLWLRRLRIRWRLIAYLPFAVAAGLLPYLYMPIASATNPPMNWGYAREIEGFYFSFNRSQYSGALSEVSVKSLGRLMGVGQPQKTEPAGPPSPTDISTTERAELWTGFFWQQLIAAFSFLSLIGYFTSFLFVFRLPLNRRVWIYLMHLAFVLAAFLQPLTAETTIDRNGWWTQMPYHTYTNLIFAILSGIGIGLLLHRLSVRRSVYAWAGPALLILPVFTFIGSQPSSSQREHWFGWMYGYDMLKDLPPDSIVIGGTDAGRFIPTYMIFGESQQPDRFKKDPSFDRRDLYIITQNALGEPNYMKYLRDQYTTERKPVGNWFESWLGRATAYPEKSIELPHQEEIFEAAKEALGAEINTNWYFEGAKNTVLFSSALKLLWEKNRDAHEFFIEESFAIPWTYDYAVPHGLIYRLNKTKVDLTPEDVARDFAFWKDYKNRLLADPNFTKDFDAQRTFSKLRQSIANIYRHRKMNSEAERAYREAIELWPENFESIARVSEYSWDRDDYDEPIRLYDTALETDPNNLVLWRLRTMCEIRREAQVEIKKLTTQLAAQPKSSEILRKIIKLHDEIGATNRVQPFVDRAMNDFPDDADMMRFLVAHYERTRNLTNTLAPALRLTELESSNVQNHILLVRAHFLRQDKEAFYQAASRTIELGGEEARRAFATEPEFEPWREDPEFKKLLSPSAIVPSDPNPQPKLTPVLPAQ